MALYDNGVFGEEGEFMRFLPILQSGSRLFSSHLLKYLRNYGWNISPYFSLSYRCTSFSSFHRSQIRWKSRLDMASCIYTLIYCEFGSSHL